MSRTPRAIGAGIHAAANVAVPTLDSALNAATDD